MADTITVTLGDRTFLLDREKAQESYASKKVINGRNSMFFNILPLKYQWAYSLYKEMKNAHWEPSEISIQTDTIHFPQLPESCQTLFKTALGVFAQSQDFFHTSNIYTIRDLLTAPELKLVFGRFVHEENTRSDLLVYLHGTLSIDPSECAALAVSPSIVAKEQYLSEHLSPLTRSTDTTTTENKQAVARNIFLIIQCMEGTQFTSLWASIFSLAAQNKLPGIGKIFSKLQQDIAYRISLFNQLLQEMREENTDFWTPEFQQELSTHMTRCVKLEQELITTLPVADAGLDPALLATYIEYLADKHLMACGLPMQYHHASSPLPWLDEPFHLSSTTIQATSSSFTSSFDDDDL